MLMLSRIEQVSQAQVEQAPQVESCVEDSGNPTDPVHQQICGRSFGGRRFGRLWRCSRSRSLMRSRTCPLDGWIGARDSEVPIIGQIQKATRPWRSHRSSTL